LPGAGFSTAFGQPQRPIPLPDDNHGVRMRVPPPEVIRLPGSPHFAPLPIRQMLVLQVKAIRPVFLAVPHVIITAFVVVVAAVIVIPAVVGMVDHLRPRDLRGDKYGCQ
jgi:hypothetical protein